MAAFVQRRAVNDSYDPAQETFSGGSTDVGPAPAQALGTCKGAGTDDVKYTEKALKIDSSGLADLHSQVVTKFNGLGGHVDTKTLEWKATCKDGDNVGDAKVTAKGEVHLPQPKEADQTKWKTSSADRDRELIGIKNYFDIIQSHERAHAKIYTDAFTGLAANLVGKTEADAATTFNNAACTSYKLQDKLDNIEGCVEVVNGKDANKAAASACGLTPNAKDSCVKP